MISNNTRYNALVVSTDPDKRATIKQAIHHDQVSGIPTFAKVHMVASLQKAINYLKEDLDFDVLIISDDFEKEVLSDFIESLKQNIKRAFGIVLVLRPSNQKEGTVAKYLMSGIDGYLCIPFSVAMLQEIAKIAEKVRAVNKEKKMQSAAGLVADMMLNEVTSKALRLARGDTPLDYLKAVKEATSLFRDGSEETQTLLIDELIERSQKSLPFENKPIYDGASERIKKKFEEEEKKREEAVKNKVQQVQVIRR
jgi:CheY-like chemotaxis protein